MSSTSSSSAPAPSATRAFTPFPALPGLRGPLADGTYARPGNGVSTLFYKYASADGQWYWTPSQEKDLWIPCSTIIVPEGPLKGKKPAYFNVEIIHYLNDGRPEPPALPEGSAPADLEWLKKDMLDNPLTATASESAKLNATLGTSNIQAMSILRDEKDQKTTLDSARVKPTDTLIFKNCRDGHYTVNAHHTKLVIDECHDCTFVIAGKVVSAVADMYKCNNIVIDTSVAIKTLQVDNCTNVKTTFSHVENFHSIVWAGTKQLTVTVQQSEPLTLNTGVDVVRAKHPTLEIRDDIDQFITRIVDAELLTEKLIRLPNGFPTTQREKDEFEARQEKNMQAFAKNAGITFKRVEHKGTKAPPRNSACECGSGKKYKQCCGSVKDQERYD